MHSRCRLRTVTPACNQAIQLKKDEASINQQLLCFVLFFCTFTCTKSRKTKRGITGFYRMQFQREGGGETNCTEYLCNYNWFQIFLMIIIAISASFVTCCMSINTADFLCQCIVHVLGIRFFFLLDIFVFFVSSEASSDEGLSCTEPQITSTAPAGLFYSLLEKKNLTERRRRRRKKHEKLLDSFGGLVLDCITTVSGVQSVIAECFLVYLCFTTSSKRKTSRVTFPPLQKQNVTIMQQIWYLFFLISFQ